MDGGLRKIFYNRMGMGDGESGNGMGGDGNFFAMGGWG